MNQKYINRHRRDISAQLGAFINPALHSLHIPFKNMKTMYSKEKST